MTDELIALLKAAKTEEEAKEILLAHKTELTDEELEKVAGGTIIMSMIPADCIGFTAPVMPTKNHIHLIA